MEEKEHEMWEIISDVLNGNVTEKRKLLLDEWVNANEKNKKALEILANLYLNQGEPSMETKNAVYRKIQNEIISEKHQRKIC